MEFGEFDDFNTNNFDANLKKALSEFEKMNDGPEGSEMKRITLELPVSVLYILRFLSFLYQDSNQYATPPRSGNSMWNIDNDSSGRIARILRQHYIRAMLYEAIRQEVAHLEAGTHRTQQPTPF